MKAIPHLQIAIDGPSGSGKGTIAQRLGEELKLAVLDTGLLYRFTAWLAEKEHILHDEPALLKALQQVRTAIHWNHDGLQFDGLNLPDLRSEKVSQNASIVAAYPLIRSSLLQCQQQLAQQGCIMDGRDIGTVVLPHAQAKFFLSASSHERARRRWLQLQASDHTVRFESVLSELKRRDIRDAQRDISPLCQAQDALHLDTTHMNINNVVEKILDILQKRHLVGT